VIRLGGVSGCAIANCGRNGPMVMDLLYFGFALGFAATLIAGLIRLTEAHDRLAARLAPAPTQA
jgi:hypothetical protein